MLTSNFARLQAEISTAVAESVADRESDYLRAAALLDRQAAIVVTGAGKSGNAAKNFADVLATIGLPAYYLDAANAMHGSLGAFRSDRAAYVVFSYSGRSPEILQILDRIGSVDIAIVGDLESPLALRSAISLPCTVDRRGDLFARLPLASYSSQVLIGNALAHAIAAKRGITEAAFAANHPGGAIGQEARV